MATHYEQKQAVVRWCQHTMSGFRLREKVTTQQWNPWQMSILISRMVKEGLLEIRAGDGLKTYAHGRVYVTTDAGVDWANQSPVLEGNKDRIDEFNDHMARAESGGKWVILPGVVSPRQKVLLRDRGFEVGTCIRVSCEAKALRSAGS